MFGSSAAENFDLDIATARGVKLVKGVVTGAVGGVVKDEGVAVTEHFELAMSGV